MLKVINKKDVKGQVTSTYMECTVYTGSPAMLF